jgi:hypothetical protein
MSGVAVTSLAPSTRAASTRASTRLVSAPAASRSTTMSARGGAQAKGATVRSVSGIHEARREDGMKDITAHWSTAGPRVVKPRDQHHPGRGTARGGGCSRAVRSWAMMNPRVTATSARRRSMTRGAAARGAAVFVVALAVAACAEGELDDAGLDNDVATEDLAPADEVKVDLDAGPADDVLPDPDVPAINDAPPRPSSCAPRRRGRMRERQRLWQRPALLRGRVRRPPQRPRPLRLVRSPVPGPDRHRGVRARRLRGGRLPRAPRGLRRQRRQRV